VYEIVPYGPALKDQLIELQRHLWSDDLALNADYFEWKYEQNPYFPEPLLQLAVQSGRMVGMRGVFGSCWEAGPASESFRIPAADDLVIHPEHRSQGLFGSIMRATIDDLAERGYPCAFTLSPGPATLAGSLTTGWKVVASMRPVQRMTTTRGIVSHLRSSVGEIRLLWRYADGVRRLEQSSSAARPFARLDREGRRARGVTRPRISVARAPRVEDMANLVRRLGHDGRLRHVRDEKYLAWRFRNPLHEYRFVFCDQERLEGYLVLQTYRRQPGWQFNIVDWEGTFAARAALLRDVVMWGRLPDVRAWTAALPDDTGPMLREHAFVPVPTGEGPLARHLPSILTRPIPGRASRSEPTLGGRRVLDPAAWDMRMLYSMAG